MFIHPARGSSTARIFGVLLGILLLLNGGFFLLFTMHVYAKRTPPKPPGLRGPKPLRSEGDPEPRTGS